MQKNITKTTDVTLDQNEVGSVIPKEYISANELLEKSFQLASNVYRSGFYPTWILAIWRGGTPVGMAIQEYFKYRDIKTDHIAIRTSSYTDIAVQSSHVRVHGLEYVVKHANASDRLLIVDDIFDTGRSVQAVLKKLQSKMRANLPTTIRIATILYKPDNNKTNIQPDFYVATTDKWVVFPHELEGLSKKEILDSKGPIIADCCETSPNSKDNNNNDDDNAKQIIISD